MTVCEFLGFIVSRDVSILAVLLPALTSLILKRKAKNMYKRNFVIACLTGVLLLTDLPIADAQRTTEEDSTISYPASYFAEYSPLTVNDMLDRVPGISLILDQSNSNFEPDARGLGASSQILIDGKRMAGKANEASSQLDRISADQVRSIEIVRGTSSDLDVQNTGQLVNIVLLESQSRSSITMELNATRFFDGEVEPGGSLAWSGQNGRLSYLLSGGLQTGYSHFESFEKSFNGDFSANDTRAEDRYSDQKTYSLNSNLAYSINDRDRIAFNLLYNESDPPQRLNRTSTDLNSLVPIVTQVRESTAATSSDWEFGGDYEHGFQNGNKFKLLFIINEEETHRTRERFSSSTLIREEAKNLFLDTSNRYKEKIVRGSYTLSLNGSQGIELGMEAAQTTQDSGLRLGMPTATAGSAEFGGLTPIPFPNAFSTVEELRFEPFAIHNWQINQRMSLASSLVAEYSEIDQVGDVNNTRNFDYLKPKLDFRFDISGALQLNANLEKVVSQLSFSDFSRATNEQDDDQNTVAGNPALVPEESLQAEVGLDYRLPNDGGALNMRVFYYDFDNKISKVDASTSAENLQSANGNVGPGQAFGLSANVSLRLGFLRLPQALFTGALTVQDAKMHNDLFTLKERRFRPYDRGDYRLGFRHDIPSLALNYGINFYARIDGNRTPHDIDNRFYIDVPSNLSVFVEKVGFGGLTYRFEGSNLEDSVACNERRRFDGYLRDGILKEVEFNCASNGMQFSFKLRGTF